MADADNLALVDPRQNRIFVWCEDSRVKPAWGVISSRHRLELQPRERVVARSVHACSNLESHAEPPDMSDKNSPASTGKAVPKLSRRRLWLFRLTAIVLGPALFCLALEVGLRVAGYGYNPNFFLKLEIGGKPFLVQNEDFSRRFFPPETMRHPNALRLPAVKAPGTIRIFVLGESAAMGDPEPGFGPARFLEVLLHQRFPGREIEIINVSFTAINSHVLLPLARECAEHDGDLWIIYMGNNEMVGPYGAATILGAQAPPRALAQLVTGIQRTRVGQLMLSVVRQIQKPSTTAASWGGMAMFQQQRVAPDSPKRATVYENFVANLDDMVRCGLDSGAGIILNTVAVNLHDSPPFASWSNVTLSAEQRTRFDELFQKAVRAHEAKQWTNAIALLDEALQLDAAFAEAHYRLADCLEQSGQLERARKHYQLACDTDALPFRTDSRENALIRETAARHAQAKLTLVDAPALMARDAPAGICGRESFYEHVHFNFDGSYRLGLAWAKAVEPFLSATTPSSTNDWATQYQCERRLGLTDLNRKLVIQSVIPRLMAPPLNAQFNNPERLQRLVLYERFLFSGDPAPQLKLAQEIFAEALAARPEDFYLLEAYAAFLQASGDLPGALREWRKVGEMLPHDYFPWFQTGSILAKQNNFAESEIHLRRALALRPDLVEGWTELGKCLGSRDDWLPALAAFEHASTLRPRDPALWAYRARVLTSLQRTNETIECYRKAVELNPAFAEAHAALGDQYSMAGRIPEAVTAYEAAIQARPDYAMAHLNLGVMFARQGRLEEALLKFRRTLVLEPSNTVAREYFRQTESRRQQKSSVTPRPNP